MQIELKSLYCNDLWWIHAVVFVPADVSDACLPTSAHTSNMVVSDELSL